LNGPTNPNLGLPSVISVPRVPNRIATRLGGPSSVVKSLVLAAALLGGCAAPRAGDGGLDQVTVPLLVEGNRPFIDVTFHRPDGSTRSARFLVDSGGGAFIIAEPLARDLGLTWGQTSREEGQEFASVTVPPKAFVGEFPLELDAKRVAVLIGTDNILPKAAPGHADGMFPGHLLAKYHVVFDYPNATFTLARPGALDPKGDALPMPVSKRSGFPRTELEVDGVTCGFLIDTGASFTMVSEVLLKSWGDKHPDWQREKGAAGEAKSLGGMTLETMFVPSARWGAHSLSEFGVVSQREGTFERYMSSMMTAPITGSLAGNVLKKFRLDMDYPNERLYLSVP
jgi:predicted aspartyl protease